MKPKPIRSAVMMPGDDNLHILLNQEGSEKFRYSTEEFQTTSAEIKVYQHTLKESYPNHWLEFYEVFFVIRGEGTHGVNGLHYRLTPGTLCLLTPVDFHTIVLTPGEEITLVGVVFDEKCIDEYLLRGLFQNYQDHHVQPPEDLSQKLYDEFKLLVEEDQKKDAGSLRLISGALERILIYLFRYTRESQQSSAQSQAPMDESYPESIRRALLYIHHHFRQRLALEEVASQACLTPNYFSERFHRLVGTSYQRYLQNLRLRFASKLLTASDLPVTEILLAAGFQDPTHFGRAFKKVYNFSPRQYRLAAQKLKV